jgi:hypothetical protein
LLITTRENIGDIDISLIPPSGFDPVRNVEFPKVLEAGSSFTGVYTVEPPPWNRSYTPGSDTREQKLFVFNVSYTAQIDGQSTHLRESVHLAVPFSISPLMYLFCGFGGIVSGTVIKAFTNQRASRQANREILWAIFGEGITGLVTNLAIGFIVLLVLSRETIPTRGWYDSVALGAAIAFLSDEKLLTKLNPLPNKP